MGECMRCVASVRLSDVFASSTWPASGSPLRLLVRGSVKPAEQNSVTRNERTEEESAGLVEVALVLAIRLHEPWLHATCASLVCVIVHCSPYVTESVL